MSWPSTKHHYRFWVRHNGKKTLNTPLIFGFYSSIIFWPFGCNTLGPFFANIAFSHFGELARRTIRNIDVRIIVWKLESISVN